MPESPPSPSGGPAPSDAPVVVGVDGSPGNAAALRWAAAEAGWLHVALLIVHAYSWTVLEPWATGDDREIVLGMRRAGEALVGQCAAEVARRHRDLEVRTEVHHGATVGVLAALSEQAAVVVLGTHRGHGAWELLGGSVSHPVSARARGTTVVVAPGLTEPEARAGVVVGVSGGRETREVLGFAVDRARRYGCPLRAVHCWRPDGSAVADPDERDPRGQAIEAMIADAVAAYAGRADGVRIEPIVLATDPSDGLLGLAGPQDLLVVGRHGVHVPAWPVLGSVSQRVVRRAAGAVAVVPPAELRT